MREGELLQHIERRSAGLSQLGGMIPAGEVVVGPGDDCAVIRSQSDELTLLTVDQLVEGVHFLPETDIDLIARKAVARSVSDIAAMGGTPAWGLATGLLPKRYPHADALFDAMAKWANHWGCPLVGGDIAQHNSPGHPLTLTTTIGGVVPPDHRPLLRSGAKVGDEVWVSGKIGGSFASGALEGRHLTFEPQVALGLLASAPDSGVTAAIDVSDGLGRDTARVARASRVTIEAHTRDILFHVEHQDDWRSACAAGEDYELLLTTTPHSGAQLAETAHDAGVALTRIGVCVQPEEDGPMCVVIDEAGGRHRADELGWEH